jgi:hypothetical protein
VGRRGRVIRVPRQVRRKKEEGRRKREEGRDGVTSNLYLLLTSTFFPLTFL